MIDGLPETHATRDFARHMAADAKQLDEDEQTGTRKYRYIKTGENHFSLAFTCAWLAACPPRQRSTRDRLLAMRHSGTF